MILLDLSIPFMSEADRELGDTGTFGELGGIPGQVEVVRQSGITARR
jgi:hypothetical protein